MTFRFPACHAPRHERLPAGDLLALLGGVRLRLRAGAEDEAAAVHGRDLPRAAGHQVLPGKVPRSELKAIFVVDFSLK